MSIPFYGSYYKVRPLKYPAVGIFYTIYFPTRHRMSRNELHVRTKNTAYALNHKTLDTGDIGNDSILFKTMLIPCNPVHECRRIQSKYHNIKPPDICFIHITPAMSYVSMLQSIIYSLTVHIKSAYFIPCLGKALCIRASDKPQTDYKDIFLL